MEGLTAPIAIRAKRDSGRLELDWSDGTHSQIDFFDLRCACPCAMCIDEITGQPLLRPETVPRDVAPVQLGLSGNYALKVAWSDGHNTGLYTWDRLRTLQPPTRV